MPEYKLTYFGIRGLAEQVRLLFIDNKIEYVEDEVDGEKWPQMKAQFVSFFLKRRILKNYFPRSSVKCRA